MRLTFTKRGGKYDDLLIERPAGTSERINCPKQGIIPHDMVHYAVESTLAHQGFLGMVAAGDAAVLATRGGDSEEAIERLVESFQAEMWGGRVATEELLATYKIACEARGHPALEVTPEDIQRIRETLDDLSRRWAATPVNGELILVL